MKAHTHRSIRTHEADPIIISEAKYYHPVVDETHNQLIAYMQSRAEESISQQTQQANNHAVEKLEQQRTNNT